MTAMTWQAVYDLAIAHGARLGADLCAVAAADSESGRDPYVLPGDAGQSWGLWQLDRAGGQGAGYDPDQLRDPDFAADIMVPLFNAAYQDGLKAGHTGERLVRYCCMYAERPFGFPALDCPAADRYAASWYAATAALSAEEPTAMTYNPDQPTELQVQPWACSIRTATWMLKSIGVATDAATMQAVMVPDYVTPALGLLQGDGSGLADVLAAQSGCATGHAWVDWAWLLDRAGTMPIGIGGVRWNHWVGVRRVTERGTLALANPAPSWMGVNTELTEADMARLGPFAAVWLDVPAEDGGEDMARIAELETIIGEMQRVATEEVLPNLDKALATRLPKAAREALESGAKPAVQTIARAGAEA